MDIANIDVVDVCQLKCATCIRGARGMPNTARVMDIALFRAILDRLHEQGYANVALYSWTEPFLNPRLHEYVEYARHLNMTCGVSTTLSLRRIRNLKQTLAAGLDVMRVSLSGSDQSTYQINHAGGDLEYVLNNLRLIRQYMDAEPSIKSRIIVRFIRFRHNLHQAGDIRALADELGFEFEAIEGGGDPFDPSAVLADSESNFRRWIGEAADRPSPEDGGQACTLLFDQIAIDCSGDVYLCCAKPYLKPLRIGKFLDMTASEILLRRYGHGFCRACPNERRQATAGDLSRLAKAMEDRICAGAARQKAAP
jgi:hypothetical protein